MKKSNGSNKILLAVILVIASLLTIVMIFFGIMIALNIYDLFTDNTEIKTLDIHENFDSIMIEGLDCNVEILPAPDELCTVEYPVSKIYSCDIDIEGGTLKIKRTDNREWFRNFRFDFDEYTISVWLPQKGYNYLDIKTVSGDIDILSSTNARLYSNNTSFKGIKAESVSGDVSAADTSAESFSLDTVSGDILIGNIQASGSVRAKTVSGDVKLDFCDASDIDIDTVSGDVKGSVTKELSYAAKTTSGDVNVPESGPDGSCSVHTVSGDINIRKAS